MMTVTPPAIRTDARRGRLAGNAAAATRPFTAEDARDPLVLRYDPSLDPIVRLAFSGDQDLTVLRRFADRKLKPDLRSACRRRTKAIASGTRLETSRVNPHPVC